MKLKAKKTDFNSLGGESQQFSVDTEDSMIIRLLRDKMYKNKVAAVCREIASNSRDANREAGRKDVPIEIEIVRGGNDILSDEEVYITFQDNGVGITPDRMEKIFLKYGGSTKRDSDKFTGGFGIGAKTPFAYTDNFFIITVAEKDGKKMKYYYQAAITGDGKREISQMISLGEEETTDRTGTTISVPINQNDITQFEKEVHFATSFWEVKPKLKGFNHNYNVEVIHNGESNYKVVKDTNQLYGQHTRFVALIDGIPYPLDLNQLANGTGMVTREMQDNARYNYNNSSDFIILFEYNTGDITVSGSREDVEYVEDNLKAFGNSNKKMKDEVKKLIEKYLSSATTYLDRCIKANEMAQYSNSYGRNNETINAKENYVKFLAKIASSVGMSKDEMYGTFEGEKVVEKHEYRMHDIEVYTLQNDGKMRKSNSLNYSRYGDKRYDLPMYYLDLAKAEPTRNARLKLNHSEGGYILIKKKPINKELNEQRKAQEELRISQEEKFFKLVGFDKKWKLYSEIEKLKKESGSKRNVTDIVKVSCRFLKNANTWSKEWVSIQPSYDKKAKEFINILETVNKVSARATKVCYFEVEKLSDLDGTGYGNTQGMDPNQSIVRELLALNNVEVLAVSSSKAKNFKDGGIKTMEDMFATLMNKKAKNDVLVKAMDFAFASKNKASDIYFELDFGNETNAKLKPLKDLLKFAQANANQMKQYLKIVSNLKEDFADKYKVGVSKDIVEAIAVLKELQTTNPLVALIVEVESLNQFKNGRGLNTMTSAKAQLVKLMANQK